MYIKYMNREQQEVKTMKTANKKTVETITVTSVRRPRSTVATIINRQTRPTVRVEVIDTVWGVQVKDNNIVSAIAEIL